MNIIIKSLKNLIFSILIISSSLHAYVLSPFKWSDSNITFHTGFNSNEDGLSEGFYTSALNSAINDWNSKSNFKYIIDSSYKNPCESGNGAGFSDNICGINFGDNTLAVAVTSSRGGITTKSNIIFNSLKRWSVHNRNSDSPYDFKRIAIHEVGHTIGLYHSYLPQSIMMPTYSRSIKTLQTDDINGIREIYGFVNASIPIPTGISASNGTYNDKVRISWDGVAGASSYKIYRATSPNGTYSLVDIDLSSPYNDTSASLGVTYYYKIKACEDSSSNDCSDYSAYNSGHKLTVPIPSAVDNTSLSFTNSGDANWVGQSSVTYYGNNAAQSGSIGRNQQSCMQTTVPGPVKLKFYWKVSSDPKYDKLKFYVNNSEQDDISGLIDWTQKSYILTSSNNTLKWCYTRKSYISRNSNAGWVDKITYAAISLPLLPPKNISASNGTYNDKVRISWDGVAGASSYKIYRATSPNGTYSLVDIDLSSPYNDTSASLGVTYYYKIKACEDSSSNDCSDYSAYNSGHKLTVPIPSAVDNTSLSFTNSGDANWVGQSSVTYYGNNAAQSGSIGRNQQSCMQTTVPGPVKLKFYWKVSSESKYDKLKFYINNNEQNNISGLIDWTQKSYILTSGNNTLKWCYIKGFYGNNNAVGWGWVDKITYTTISSLLPPKNISTSNGTYNDKVRISWNGVAGASSYKIYRATSPNGTYSLLSNSSSPSPYNDTSASLGVTYYYKIKACTGLSGNGICSNYSAYKPGYKLKFIIYIPNAIDNTSLSFTNSGDANWVGQPSVTYYGNDAAQSGSIGHNQQSCMQTTVPGPVKLKFYWKVSSERAYDKLKFYINNNEQDDISGLINWTQKSYILTPGNNTLKWCYIKDGNNSDINDAGWVDKITYTTFSPLLPPKNISVSNGTYNNKVRIIWSYVINASSYKIYRATSPNGTYSLLSNSSSPPPYNDTSASLGVTYYYKIKACTGLSGNGICSNYSAHKSGYRLYIITIPNAIDNTSLSFTNSGDANWAGQSFVTYYGNDAAQSGSIGHNQQSCMQATVPGPVKLKFYWKVSSEPKYDKLKFYINDNEQDNISGLIDWTQKSYILTSGNNTLKWCYIKDGSRSNSNDAGWVDKITYTTISSLLPPKNISASNGTYNNKVHISWNGVAGASSYKIYRATSPNGTYSLVDIDLSSPYDDTSVIIDDTLYYYKIKACTGLSGNGICSNYSAHKSGYRLYIITIPNAIDNTSLSFTNSGDANWAGQSFVTYYGNDAAQSGSIGHNQQSCMQATVPGPVKLKFYWKVSSEPKYDKLKFYINDNEQDNISGLIDWTQKSYILTSGNNTLKWCYIKDGSRSNSNDAGWVDKITYTTISSLLPPKNISASNGTYNNKVHISWNGVAGASSYKIYRATSPNGTYSLVDIDLSSPYDDTSVIIDDTLYYYKIKACTGLSGNGICSNYSAYKSGYKLYITMPNAIDNTSLSFTNSGDANWAGQSFVTYYGNDAAQSGSIGHNQQSCMQATVPGPVKLKFYWKVSSEPKYDKLKFYINDNEQDNISGLIDWTQKSYILTSGNNTLKWCYIKDGSRSNSNDAGWVDKITYTTISSLLPPKNISASNGTYNNKVHISWNGVAGASSYKIYRATSPNGTYSLVDIDLSSPYDDTSVIIDDTLYYYKIKACTGLSGNGICSNYSAYKSGYKFYITMPNAIDNTSLSFTNSGDANWAGQSFVTYYGNDAAQSGSIGHNQQSCMQATVPGPVKLKFYWKVSSEPKYDKLKFYINDNEQDNISGLIDWTQKSYILTSGNNTLKWCYIKDGSRSNSNDAGWVDKITYTTISSLLPPKNISASNGTYNNKVHISWNGVAKNSGENITIMIEIVKGRTHITTVNTTDEDAGQVPSFTLSGTNSNLFSITPVGVLTFKLAQIFDSTTSANNLKEVVITASSNGKSTSQTITVQTIDFIDTDNDGIADTWEQDNFGDLTSADANSDTDNDGATDISEFLANSNPKEDGVKPVFNTITDASLNAKGRKTAFLLADFKVTAEDFKDGEITPIAILLNDKKAKIIKDSLLLPSGSHIITWSATDNSGNIATTTQVIKVNPLVNFYYGQTGSNEQTLTISVSLSGKAVEYPVSIPFSVTGIDVADYSVSSETITIDYGRVGTVSFSIKTSNANTVVLTMGAPTNATKGKRNSQKISILAEDDNRAPIIKGLEIKQNNILIGNSIPVTAGQIIITPNVFDANNDAMTYTWVVNPNHNSDLIISGNNKNKNTYSFDPSGLTIGKVQHITLEVNDGTTSTSKVLALKIIAANKVVTDTNGNGINDSKEVGYAPHELHATVDKIIRSVAGIKLSAGKMADGSGKVSKQQMKDYIAINGGKGIEDILTTGDIFDYVAENLANIAGTTTIIIELENAIPSGAVLRKYSLTDGWDNFVENDKNIIESQISTDCNNENWSSGLLIGGTCLRITIEDGGLNDTDGKPNGSIEDPLSISTNSEASTSGNGGGGCALSSKNNNKIDPLLPILVAISLIALLRRRFKFKSS